jgi:hypothetical protein
MHGSPAATCSILLRAHVSISRQATPNPWRSIGISLPISLPRRKRPLPSWPLPLPLIFMERPAMRSPSPPGVRTAFAYCCGHFAGNASPQLASELPCGCLANDTPSYSSYCVLLIPFPSISSFYSSVHSSESITAIISPVHQQFLSSPRIIPRRLPVLRTRCLGSIFPQRRSSLKAAML